MASSEASAAKNSVDGNAARKAGGAGKRKAPRELSPLDLLKLEIAAELGLTEKVASEGWANLTAVETGRLGGILNQRLRERRLTIGPKGSLLPLDR